MISILLSNSMGHQVNGIAAYFLYVQLPSYPDKVGRMQAKEHAIEQLSELLESDPGFADETSERHSLPCNLQRHECHDQCHRLHNPRSDFLLRSAAIVFFNRRTGVFFELAVSFAMMTDSLHKSLLVA